MLMHLLLYIHNFNNHIESIYSEFNNPNSHLMDIKTTLISFNLISNGGYKLTRDMWSSDPYIYI